MPFVFLFDAKDVLTRANTRFSNGNLGKPGTEVDGSSDFFKHLPFQEIYHEGAFSAENRDRLVNRRHAEVIVPERLDLSPLRYIWCRSGAEYQTLVNSLQPATQERYLKRIGAEGHGALHFRRWTYIEEATLEQNRAVFRFNPSTQTPGPFAAKVTISAAPDITLEWNDPQFQANKPFTLSIPQLPANTSYLIEFKLNDDRAYMGRYTTTESAVPEIFL